MNRRSFIKALGAGVLVPFVPGLAGKPQDPEKRTVFLQSTNLAGHRYYECERVWRYLDEGEPLDLVREAGNRHDGLAIEVFWRGRKLGYVPRYENPTPSLLMDQDVQFAGRITRKREFDNGWKRLEFDVLMYVA